MKLHLNIQYSIIFCFLISNQSLAMHASKPLSINPRFLKGTHNVLANTNYAPFWGLAIIENDLAQQWYTLSAKQQNKENMPIVQNAQQHTLVTLNKEKLLSMMAQQKNAPIQDLVLQMFHIAGGTFTLTRAVNNPVSQFTPKIIGQILRKVHDAKIYDDAFLKSMEDFLVTLQLKDPSNKDFKAKDFRPFAKALTASLQEFIQNQKDPLYITQQVLLGFMLCKSTTKADLELYFTGFEGKPVKISDEMFTPTDIAMIPEIVNFTIDNTPFLEFADFVCTAIYQNKYAAKLPKMASNVMVNYNTYRFADCMEATMLNLANIATYDAVKNHLGASLNNVSISPELTAFYQKKLNHNPAEVDNINVHNDWVVLVENIVGAAYQNIGISQTGISIPITDKYAGAIPVPSFDSQLPIQEIFINNQSYQCNVANIDKEQYLLVPQNYNLTCFELMPTISNIVVIMNHLFNLNLINTTLDIFQSDFAVQQFEKLCEKFSWSINTDLEMMKHDKIINLKLFTKDRAPFTIDLYHKRHASVSVEHKSSIKKTDSYFLKDINQLATLLSCGLASIDKPKTNNYYSKLYWYHPAITMNQCFECLQKFAPATLLSENLSLQSYIGSMIINMANAEDSYYHNIHFTEEMLNLKTISNSLLTMASLIYLKYGESRKMIEYINIFINNKLFNKGDDIKVLIEGVLDTSFFFDKFAMWKYLNDNYQDFDKELLNKWIDTAFDSAQSSGHSRALNIICDLFFKINNSNEIWEKIKKLMKTMIVNEDPHYTGLSILAFSLKNSKFNDEFFKDLEKIDQMMSWCTQYGKYYVNLLLITFINELIKRAPKTADQAQEMIDYAKKFLPSSKTSEWQQQLDEKNKLSQTHEQSMLDFARHGTGALRSTGPKLMNYNPVEYQRLQQSTQQQMRKQRDDLQKNYESLPISTTDNQAEFITPLSNQQSQSLPLQVPKTARPASSMLRMPKASNIKNAIRAIK